MRNKVFKENPNQAFHLRAKNAMANILLKLNDVTSQVVTESRFNPQLDEAIHTKKTDSGVKIGNYKILIKEDQSRIAGKQFYGIYNIVSGDIIADESLCIFMCFADFRVLFKCFDVFSCVSQIST